MIRIAILGSGQGSIARAIADDASHSSSYCVSLLVTPSADSGFPAVAREYGLECEIIPYVSQQEFAERLNDALARRAIDLLVLAGFTRLLPASVIHGLRGNVINTHPAPLPEFGGKGMYGLHVHEAVLNARLPHTAITVHWVTDEYDTGAAIGVLPVAINPEDTPESLQQRVKTAEGPFVAAMINALTKNRA